MKELRESMKIVGELLMLEDEDSANSSQTSEEGEICPETSVTDSNSSFVDQTTGNTPRNDDHVVVTSRRRSVWHPRSLW
jgi:hypothetical protein